jgi:hypothetical protein
MVDHRARALVFTGCLVSALVGLTGATPASASPGPTSVSPSPAAPGCGPGAHTLSAPGSRMYPETGNGGYTSVHTDVFMVYDADTDMFLPGNHVTLTDQATQCLTSFSLDFERTSANVKAGPDMTVSAVSVNGQPALFSFVQPTYPGDPHGQDDPDPAAHEVSQTDPVGGPHHNPLPPACSPELPSGSAAERYAQDGRQCPADKLVVTPASAIADGATFTVEVDYTGRPGLHDDGDGEEEGWYRIPGGGFVESEPLGSEDWMPLNNYPTAKPTYDFYDTVAAGKTAVANGVLEGQTTNPPSAEFPDGSVTWHWNSMAPVASYLAEDSVGDFTLNERTVDGIRFYEVQEQDIDPPHQKKNLRLMNKQPGITAIEAAFTGVPFPFPSDGVIVSTAKIDSAEEMQTMITFGYGGFGLDTLYHENMHQWWGDHVTEGGYAMTFFKEGMATLGQDLLPARQAEWGAGGPSTAAGQAAFNGKFVDLFDTIYSQKGSFWALAPSDPEPFTLFNNAETYARPSAAYIALRQILGPTNFDQALQDIQSTYGGSSITESELEEAFEQQMPVKSTACTSELQEFFVQWFDTAYPAGAKPQITGPGLDGPGFYNADGGCGPS